MQNTKRNTKRNTLFAPLLLLPWTLALAGCGGGGGSYSGGGTIPGVPALAVAPVGTLGANNISLQVTAAGGAVTLPCGASGQITQPLTLDASGHFDVAGTLSPVTGAPRPTPPPPVPARFTGTTDGKTMTLTITPSPLGAPASGVYALTYGAPTVTTVGACPG